MKIFVTGAYGFIGSNLVRSLLQNEPKAIVHAMDSMTYAAQPEHVFDFIQQFPDMRARFRDIPCDLNEARTLELIFDVNKPDFIFHLAAESHVCRSIDGPRQFFQTNVMGTFNLMEAIRKCSPATRVIHVSTDEVFGELQPKDLPFNEYTQLAPRSPYAASKAASDHLVLSYAHTYGLNATVANCSNNFGANQHAEKLIPKVISSILSSKPVTVYGDGQQVRDWLYVGDTCAALTTLAMRGVRGSRYCVGGNNERKNLDVVEDVLMALRQETGEAFDVSLVHTNDRPTDDRRYAVNTLAMHALGWSPSKAYHDNLRNTVRWYLGKLGRGPVAQDSGSRKS